jgi:hypothetical protein
MCALNAYYKSKNPVMKYRRLIHYIKDRFFSDTLKDIRKKSFIESTNSIICDTSEDYDETYHFTIDDIGDVFNYSYWFFWDNSEFVEDYKISMTPVNKMEIEDRLDFYNAVFSLLPSKEKISDKIVHEDEILMSITSSSCRVDNNSTKTSKVYKEKMKKNKFSSSALRGLRCVVPAGPSNYRDTILLSVEQSNSVKIIDKQVSILVRDMEYSAHIKDPIEFQKILRKQRKKNNFFLDRDIEKEGLTKPRELIQVIGEAIKDKYGDLLPCMKYWGIYSGFVLTLDDGTKINTRRGTGLGMANSITTLMQCALFKVIYERFLKDGESYGETLDALFLNDDCEIASKCEATIESYDDFEDTEIKKFGILKKKSKTHKGNGTVFCEEYYHRNNNQINDKESYRLYSIYRVFSAHNIMQAKMFAANCQVLNELGDQGVDIIREYISFWGYEFYEDEWNSTSSFGGWLSPKFFGINLEHYSRPDFTREEYKAYLTLRKYSKIYRLGIRENNHIFEDPIVKKFGPKLIVDDRISNYIPYRQSYSDIERRFIRIQSVESLERSYDYIYEKRIELYNKINIHPSSLTSKKKYELLLDLDSTTTFFPHHKIVKGKEEDMNYEMGRIPFYSSTPIMSALRFFNDRSDLKEFVPDIRTLITGKNESYSRTDFDNLERRLIKDYRVKSWEYDLILSIENFDNLLFEKKAYMKCLNPQYLILLISSIYGTKRYRYDFLRNILTDKEAEYIRFMESNEAQYGRWINLHRGVKNDDIIDMYKSLDINDLDFKADIKEELGPLPLEPGEEDETEGNYEEGYKKIMAIIEDFKGSLDQSWKDRYWEWYSNNEGFTQFQGIIFGYVSLIEESLQAGLFREESIESTYETLTEKGILDICKDIYLRSYENSYEDESLLGVNRNLAEESDDEGYCFDPGGDLEGDY